MIPAQSRGDCRHEKPRVREQPSRIPIEASVEPDHLPVASNDPTFGGDANCSGETVRDEVGAKIEGETVGVPMRGCQAGNLGARLEEPHVDARVLKLTSSAESRDPTTQHHDPSRTHRSTSTGMPHRCRPNYYTASSHLSRSTTAGGYRART